MKSMQRAGCPPKAAAASAVRRASPSAEKRVGSTCEEKGRLWDAEGELGSAAHVDELVWRKCGRSCGNQVLGLIQAGSLGSEDHHHGRALHREPIAVAVDEVDQDPLNISGVHELLALGKAAGLLREGGRALGYLPV